MNPVVNLKICQRKVKFTVDTGSTINVIDQATFHKLPSVQLRKTKVKAYHFNTYEPVRMKGKFQTVLKSRRKMTVATIYVTEANGGCLLSAGTAQELGLITLHLNTITTNNHPARMPAKDKDVQNIVDKYPQVFQGQGKLQSKQIELIIDQAVKPVTQRQRRIPFHLRAKVEKELTKLQNDDIIEPVRKPKKQRGSPPL